MSTPTSSPKRTVYDIPSTKPRLSLRKVIDKIAEFLKTNNIYWTGIELESIECGGNLSPGTSSTVPAGKSLRIYVTDPEEPTAVSYLFQQSGFVTDQLPDGIERVEFVKIQRDEEVLASPREKNRRRDSEEE